MCHVLVIEDDWFIADHISQLVETAGALTIDVAATEDDAIALALACPPAVIISDVHLRAGTGPGAVERIMAELGMLPVMFVTGEPRAFKPCIPDTPVLHKPFEEQELIATFKMLAPLP